MSRPTSRKGPPTRPPRGDESPRHGSVSSPSSLEFPSRTVLAPISTPASPTALEFNLQTPPQRYHHGSTGGGSLLSDMSRPTSSVYNDEFRFKTMITYLKKRLVANGWMPTLSARGPREVLGVLYKRARGEYVTYPEHVQPSLLACVQRLNLVVAFTMKPSMLQGMIATLMPGQSELRLMDGSQLQIAESLDSMVTTNIKKYQYACLVRQEGCLLVWHDDLQEIIPTATRLEEKLLSLVWGESSLPFSLLPAPSRPQSTYSSVTSLHKSVFNEKAPVVGINELGVMSNNSSEGLEKAEDLEAAESLSRPIVRNSAAFTGMSTCLAIVLLFGFYISQLLIETTLDGTYTRFALIVCIPFLLCVSLFFFQVIFTNIFQMIGPIGGQNTNSRYYSCIKPNLRRAYMDGFEPPHISIQLPVYKEGMDSVIMPTVRSLQAAISYYESHGGSASIFVNDDGLRAGISEEDVQKRIEFYHDNHIGWVARPKHGADGFVRKGKFKKASNMNFALNISQKVETYLQGMVDARGQAEGSEMIDEQEEEDMYQQALARVLEENPLAQAAGNIRVGEFILICDSDTRVPVDCLLYGAAEMFMSPELAIVQHSTGVMQVSWDYFENGITFFTNLVYTAINFAVGSGEVAPFVGHNAFLRWKAVQDVGVTEEGGYVAYWSESHVSEDFDIALRLQIKGNIVRCASYHNGQFQEGVSLTIYDEIARWQKYAYGVSEMIFHPMYQWPWKGPFTPLLFTFIGSSMPYSSKISVFAYMCSYFALASALMLTMLNYFLVGWFADSIDHAYTTSWQVFVSLIVVFNIMGHVALAALRYRNGDRSLLGSLFENLKWMPLLTVFFGGISFHVTGALLAHLFHVDMQWGATSKEKENSNFFLEIPKILKTFKYMYIFVMIVSAGMIYLARFAPRGWTITDFTAIVPLAVNLVCHAINPLVLNPSLMVFNY